MKSPGSIPEKLAPTDDLRDWAVQLEAACKARGITTREGLVFDETTGEVSDAMAWELEND